MNVRLVITETKLHPDAPTMYMDDDTGESISAVGMTRERAERIFRNALLIRNNNQRSIEYNTTHTHIHIPDFQK